MVADLLQNPTPAVTPNEELQKFQDCDSSTPPSGNFESFQPPTVFIKKEVGLFLCFYFKISMLINHRRKILDLAVKRKLMKTALNSIYKILNRLFKILGAKWSSKSNFA